MASENKAYITNNHSILSKYSAIKYDYFNDHLLEQFIEDTLNIRKGWRRTPLINRGYAARLLAIDWIVSRSIKNESIDCVIILGAGFDTLAFRNIVDSSQNRATCWIEIDLPQVVDIKAKFVDDKSDLIFGDNEAKLNQDGNIYSSKEMNYHLISCDMKDTLKLSSSLSRLRSKITKKSRIMILNEVCLCYLELNYIKGILRSVIDTFQEDSLRIHYVGYEQLKPNSMSQMNEIMLNHFQALGYPLKYFPTSSDIKKLFKNDLNFNHININSMYEIYHNVLFANILEIKGFIDQVFDEFEEMDLYLSHYALVTGVLILKDPFLDEIITNTKKILNLDNSTKSVVSNNKHDIERKNVEFIKSNLKRYGHSSCVINFVSSKDSNLIDIFFVTGGFGTVVDNHYKHKRLYECEIIQKNLSTKNYTERYISKNLDLSQFSNGDICLDRMHGQVQYLGQNSSIPFHTDHLIFFNGGRQSPIKHDTKNINFIAYINDDYQLRVKHKFKQDDTVSVWRHKTTRMNNNSDSIFQVGGISLIESQYPIINWNFSSDKMGHEPLVMNDNISNEFRRHSFAMDINKSTILIVGGLMTFDAKFRDRLCENQVILYDIRANVVSKPNIESVKGYGANINFINDYEFIKFGGITSKGFLMEEIELIDLRNFETVQKYDTYLTDDNNSIEFPVTMTNFTTGLLESEKEIYTIGGGGNYFTFGSKFSSSHLKLKYN